VDQLLEQTTGGTQSLIGGTKGSHIVVAPFPGAPSSAIYVEAKTDRRPFFIIPWNGNYLIGTTDIRFDGDLDRVQCDSSEVDYLLVETNRVLPQSKLTRKEILYTYSGVRPLPMTAGKNAQSITRRHFIREHPQIDNLLSVVGGKLTTYRSLAEQSVDLVFRKLKKNSVRCTTAQVSLPGGTEFAAFANEFREQNPFAAAVNNRLLRIYGTRANDVVQFCMSDAALSRPFNKADDVLAGEVVFSFAHELAESLSDCLLRRTMVGLNGDLAIGDDETAADIGKRFLGWSPERAAKELRTYRSYIERLRTPRGN
jgi:glycerol-3-phosphate dehydrogenase